MKTRSILASAFIFCAISVNTFATDATDNIINSIETNKSGAITAFTSHGRNLSIEIAQKNKPSIEYASIHRDELIAKEMLPKGRNTEIVDTESMVDTEENAAFYADLSEF